MPLETKCHDPGERRVDNPEPHPFRGLHGYVVGNSSIDRDGVADTARHPRFHPVAEAACNPSIAVESPIFDKPQQVAIDGDRLTLLDDQSASKAAPNLLQRVGMWVIPEGASIGRRELVDKALAGADGWLCDLWHAIHRIRQADAVPVDGRSLAELIVDHHPDPIALTDAEFRAGHGPVIGPDGGIRITVAGQIDDRLFCGQPVFLDF